jgi:hypothetical protein
VGTLLILLTGCTPIKVSDNNYQTLINNVLAYGNNYNNNASVGYKYYLPRGLKVVDNKDYNQTFKYLDNYIYLYVDIVSYYYKNSLNLSDTTTNHYYYSKINDKGYILIDEEEEGYFLKIVYNYAKIECYSTSKDLNSIITYSMIILNSVNYNDLTIESILNNSSASSSEMNYEIDGPNSDGTFSQFLEEYIDEEEDLLPDE